MAKLIAQNSNRLKFIPKEFNPEKKHSDIWHRFKEATIDDKRVGIFKCDNCMALYIYKSSTGNSTMNKCDNDASNAPAKQKTLMTNF